VVRCATKVILWEHTPHLYKRDGDRANPPAKVLQGLGYWVSELHFGGAGNYVALHPRVPDSLRRALLGMQAANLADVKSQAGIDAHIVARAKGEEHKKAAPRTARGGRKGVKEG
jgi:hypothetical protein